ncbi:NADH-quinone oxidoreductase subunit N [Luteitalea pratensis]|uniref:NADH-quinone oxidoreductase subunit N n=1 Tax=Luteitalea pratensis TaxID=1855912 RepID=A0A143PF87_LUTPR|nr:NADH-quinone oxidoreductase subunit N [Luteitalea pratensis]AMY06943.1 NADH-quinone oxidoreductase subunit N [Luteitalea pratensis]
MRDLLVLLPELVLAGVGLVLIVAARRITRAGVAAGLAIVAAAVAAFAGLAMDVPTMGFGGTVTTDGYAVFFKLLFAANLALVALLSVRHFDAERVRPAEYHALLVLATTGMMLTASAVEFLMLYLGLELMSLCAYVLVGITRDKAVSNEAAMKYFLLGSFASALLLYGISLVYGVTGATDFATIAAHLKAGTASGAQAPSPLLGIAVALIVAGLAFKIAAVPFHAWAPDAYEGASTPVAGFLAAGSKAAGLAALGRVCMVAFVSEQGVWSSIMVVLAVLSMTVASLLALAQTSMKRMLAYSSVAHAGYALLGLIAGTADGASATMTYAFVYAFMTLGAFGIVVGMGERGETLDGYRGLAATTPWTAWLMFLFLLSLTGIPPTAGFAAKFGVILSAVQSGHLVLAVVAVLCSIVSAFFYLRVAVLMFMSDVQTPAPGRFPAAVSAAVVLAAFVTIVGGIFPGTFAVWASAQP